MYKITRLAKTPVECGGLLLVIFILLSAGCSKSDSSVKAKTISSSSLSSSSSSSSSASSSNSSTSGSATSDPLVSSSSGTADVTEVVTIKVGSLHSLTGILAPSEQHLNAALVMMVDEQNEKGGLLGKPIEVVSMNLRSHLNHVYPMARMIMSRGVDVLFSGSVGYVRASTANVVEKNGGLMFYPKSYEGEESLKSVIYSGSVPNQFALPALEHLINQGYERWALDGSTGLRSRTVSRIVERYLLSRGFVSDDITVEYHDAHDAVFDDRAAEIFKFASEDKKTAIISTVDYTMLSVDTLPFYEALGAAGVTPDVATVVELLMTEEELSRMDTTNMSGHKIVANYFMSLDSPENSEFIEKWQTLTNDTSPKVGAHVASYHTSFNAWVAAVESAGTTDPDAVRKALYDVEITSLSGDSVSFLPNHHVTQSTYMGTIQSGGTVGEVIKIGSNIAADSWSDYLPESETLISDWVDDEILCGKFDTFLQRCVKHFSWHL